MSNDKQKSAAVDAKISSLLPETKKPKTTYTQGYRYGGYGAGYNYDQGYDSWDDVVPDYSAAKGRTGKTHYDGYTGGGGSRSTGDYYLRKFEYQIGPDIDVKHVVDAKMGIRRAVRAIEQLWKTAYEYDLDEHTLVVGVPDEVARRQMFNLENVMESAFEAMNLELSPEGKAQLKLTLAGLLQEQVAEKGTGRAMGYPTVGL